MGGIEMDAVQTLEHWSQKLNAARAALATFEQSMGTRALREDAGTLASELATLRGAVTIAEAAHAAAAAIAPDPRITGKRAQLARAQAELDAVNAELAEIEAVLAELTPKYNQAVNQGTMLARRSMALDWRVISLGNELRSLERGG
jgi:capsule polysaccharide export protein KpsE/RkpR